jgi:site-specific recombinase XerC
LWTSASDAHVQKPHDRKQLYELTPRDFQFPNYVDSDGHLHLRPADNLPLLTWPDGSWCHSGNTFLRELFEKGLSRRNRGGSLAVAAAQLTHLLRYCWRQQCDPLDLTDSQFSELLLSLRDEIHPRDPSRMRRNANTVIATGRTCLTFLESVGKHAGVDGFVGPEGRIRAEKREHQVALSGSRREATRTVTYWHHNSFPNPGALKTRMPISAAKIEALRKAVGLLSTTAHQRARRHTILKLLEITGARRGEIALITVASVHDAQAMSHPMLRIPTLKKRGDGNQHRYVPLCRADLAFFQQYADVHRRSAIRRHLRGAPDHGLLLINGRNGQALATNTITDEVRKLAKAAGIEEKACPHMFRHRFITKLFVALIEHHALVTKDDFRRLLISSEQLKTKIAEWTDHASMESINHYIDLAFDEIGEYKRIYDLVGVGIVLDAFAGTIEAEMQAVHAGEQPLLILDRLRVQLSRLKEDLARAKPVPA